MKHQTMKKGTLAALSLATALGLALTGCSGDTGDTPGSSGGEEKPSELTVLITDSPSAQGLEAIAPAFTEKTGIKITFVKVPYEQLSTKVVLAGQSKTASFDVVQFDQFAIATVAPSGGLLPIGDYAANDPAYDIADFDPALQDYGDFEDVTYGVPFSTEPYTLFYRTDLYEQAGVEVPTTWDEINSNAKAISALGSEVYGYDGPYGPGWSIEAYLERLLATGGRLLDPETGEPLLNTEFAKETMREHLDLVEDSPEASISGIPNESAMAFSQQEVGQFMSVSGWYGQLADPEKSRAHDKFAAAAVPLENLGPYEPASILSGWLIGVNAFTEYKDASWEFISYAMGPDNVQAFIDAGAPVVGRISTLENASYQEQYPYLATLRSAIQFGTPLPTVPQLGEIHVVGSQAVSEMASQGADVDSTMDALNDKIAELLAQG